MARQQIKATVFIPTFNGQDYLNDILRMVFRQKTDFLYDVLIIDSGSTDKTLKIIEKYSKKHKNLTLKQIPNVEYGHGKTRAAAAHIAKGDIVVYLSHDAVPAHDHWLYEMVKPFEISEKIAGVVGKQEPRPKCVPLLKSEIRSVFKNMGPDSGLTLYYDDYFIKNQSTYDMVSFYSDVNSAARRSVLIGDVPYKDVPYAEDQLFGRDIINAGYIKVYSPRGAVQHSNDIPLRQYKMRMFDETMGLRKVGIPVNVPSRKFIFKMVVKGIIKDWWRTIKDGEYSFKRKIFWLTCNPFYHIEKWRGIRLAAKINIDDLDSVKKYSLESYSKKS